MKTTFGLIGDVADKSWLNRQPPTIWHKAAAFSGAAIAAVLLVIGINQFTSAFNALWGGL